MVTKERSTSRSAGKTNLIGLTRGDYKGMPTTLCQGCGHNSISSQIIAACYENSIPPEKLIKISGLSDLKEPEVRRKLALVIIPIFSVFKTIVIFFLFYYSRVNSFYAIILCILDSASFSRILFGSIPEHFALTAFATAVLYCLVIISIDKGKMAHKAGWMVLGVFLIGITITNIFTYIIHLVWMWEPNILSYPPR